MRLIITAAARNDLREIADYIAGANPLRSVKFLDELQVRLERLTLLPYAYPLVPRYEASGVRRAVHKGYLIFYRIRDNSVVVRRVLHGSRDYVKFLFPSDI